MKVAYVLLDGVGDCPHMTTNSATQQYYGKTPLQAAHTPNLDKLATQSKCGLMDPVRPGLACGSDTAHLNLFGYSPEEYYVGRGCYETLGAGMELSPGDVAFKSNFAVIDDDNMVIKRRCDRSFEAEGPVLSALLDGTALPHHPDVSIKVMYTTEHRCAVAISGPGFSDQITGTDPLVDGRPALVAAPIDPNDSAAQHTADVVNEMSAEFTKKLADHPINVARVAAGKHPANFITCRGPGSLRPCTAHEDRFGFTSAVAAPTAIIRGVAAAVGIPLLPLPKSATGGLDSDVAVKVDAGIAALDAGTQFVFIHMKGIDDAGHDGEYAVKVAQIEAADAALAPLIARDDVAIIVSGDHSTPIYKMDHSFEPVPVMLRWGSPDDVARYDEPGCSVGALGRFPGERLMPLIRTIVGAEE